MSKQIINEFLGKQVLCYHKEDDRTRRSIGIVKTIDDDFVLIVGDTRTMLVPIKNIIEIICTPGVKE